MLPARSAPKIRPRQQHTRALVPRKIHHEIRIRPLTRIEVPPVVKQDPPKPFARQRLQKLLRHHLIGIHIHPIQRHHHPRMRAKRLHLFSKSFLLFFVVTSLLRCFLASPFSYSTFATSNSRTSTKCPAIAAAAAITGDTRCVRESRPCRPSKLRFEVDALRSCAGNTSSFIPMHMLHPASRHSNPASVKILSSPSFSACVLIPRDPGTTSACFTLRATCLPATRCAAARKSSIREFVQDPINTRSIGISTIGVPALSPIY